MKNLDSFDGLTNPCFNNIFQNKMSLKIMIILCGNFSSKELRFSFQTFRTSGTQVTTKF